MKKIILTIAIILFFTPYILWGTNPVGKLIEVKGRVDVFKLGRNFAVKAKLGENVYIGDIYRVKSNSFAVIKFINNNILKIGPKSKVKIENFYSDSHGTKTEVKLSRGKVEALTAKKLIRKIGTLVEKNVFEVKTPTAVAGVKGTNFVVFYLNNITGVLFLEGKGYVYNPKFPKKVRFIKAGEISYLVNSNQPPTKPRKATKNEIKTIITKIKISEKKATSTVKTEAKPKVKLANADIETSAEISESMAKQSNEKKEIKLVVESSYKEEVKNKSENKVNNDISSSPATKTKVEEVIEKEETQKTPPEIKIIELPQFVNKESLENIKIYIYPEGEIQYSLDKTNWKNNLEDLNLNQGENTIYIRGIDKEGNISKIKEISFIYDTIPPQINSYNSIKYSLIPENQIKVDVNDNNFDKIEVNEKSFLNTDINLDDLNLDKGLNIIKVKAYDKAGNYSDIELPIFIGEEKYNLTGQYSYDNFKNEIDDGLLSINFLEQIESSESEETSNNNGVSLFYFTLPEKVEELSNQITAGGTIGNNEGYWLYSNTNSESEGKFRFILDNIFGETDNTIENQYLNKVFINPENHEEITSTNYLKLFSAYTTDYKMNNLENNSNIDLKAAFLPYSITTIGKTNNLKNDYYKGSKDFSLRIDKTDFKTKGNFQIFNFNNKIYGAFTGYIQDSNGLKQLVLPISGESYKDINMLSFFTNGGQVNQLQGDINDISFFKNEFSNIDNDKNYIASSASTEENTFSQISYSPVFSYIDNQDHGLTFGEFTGKYSKTINIDQLSHVGGVFEGKVYTDFYIFWGDLLGIDKTDSQYLKKISNGIILSPTKISLIDGYVIGDYNTNEFTSGFFGTWQNLKYFSFINFFTTFNDVDNYDLNSSTNENISQYFSFYGELGGIDSLLSSDEQGSHFYILTTFSQQIKKPFLFSSQIYPINYSNYSETTYEGDSYYINFGGYFDDNLNINGYMTGIYVNKDGDTGLLFSDVSGTGDNNIMMAKMEGDFLHIFKENKVIDDPKSLFESIVPLFPNNKNGQSNFEKIYNENWGVYQTNFLNTSDNNFIYFDQEDNKLYSIVFNGKIDSFDKNLNQNVYGYGGTIFNEEPQKSPITWISVGKALGVKDITNNNFKVIITGAWFETKNFLEMAQIASTNPDLLKKLQQVNIPCVQVGKANLEGTNGNLNVTMEDVTFFAVHANEKPKVWATGNVYGYYKSTPNINESVNLIGTNNFSAKFIIKNWENHKWLAQITDGKGTLIDKYKGNISFKGVATGTYIETPPTYNNSNLGNPPGNNYTGEFKGTAAGTVE